MRYGCCSFLSELLVKTIRSGPKFNKVDVNALEQLLSELNDYELYARAYKQTSSLNSSFIMDIAERMPLYFKTCYTDYFVDHCGNPNDPSFDTFITFLSRELKTINTTFAQRLLGSVLHLREALRQTHHKRSRLTKRVPRLSKRHIYHHLFHKIPWLPAIHIVETRGNLRCVSFALLRI